MPPPELSTPLPVNAIDITPSALQTVLKVIGAGIVLISLYNFFKTKTGQLVLIVLFVIAIIVGVGYSFFYSDKNGDGESEPMIIGMVQMNGTDSERDKSYSEINGNNGSTNLKTVGAGFIWFTGFLIALVVISGVIICLKYALKL
jgi:hypothetical protein